jgi:hypothetical protein
MSVRLLILSLAVVTGCQKLPEAHEQTLRAAEAHSALLRLHEQSRNPTSTMTAETYQFRVDSILTRFGFTRESFRTTLQQLARDPIQLRHFSQKLLEPPNGDPGYLQ